MNCELNRNYILLRESGELKAIQRKALETHLISCAECRKYEEESSTLVDLVRTATLEAEPGKFTLHHIREAAENHRSRTPTHNHVRKTQQLSWITWRPAILYAAAAVALLFIGTTFLYRESSDMARHEPPSTGDHADAFDYLTWAPSLDEEFAEVYDLLGSVTDDLEGEDDIASDLLLLEGWNI